MAEEQGEGGGGIVGREDVGLVGHEGSAGGLVGHEGSAGGLVGHDDEVERLVRREDEIERLVWHWLFERQRIHRLVRFVAEKEFGLTADEKDGTARRAIKSRAFDFLLNKLLLTQQRHTHAPDVPRCSVCNGDCDDSELESVPVCGKSPLSHRMHQPCFERWMLNGNDLWCPTCGDIWVTQVTAMARPDPLTPSYAMLVPRQNGVGAMFRSMVVDFIDDVRDCTGLVAAAAAPPHLWDIARIHQQEFSHSDSTPIPPVLHAQVTELDQDGREVGRLVKLD